MIHRTTEQKIELYFINEDDSPDFISYDRGIGGGFGVLYNNGGGVFTHHDIYTAIQTITEPAVADLNGDSLNDILLSDDVGGAYILYNQGEGLFDQETLDIYPSTDTCIFDINNDGFNDLGIFYHVFFPNGICRLEVYENQSDNFVLTATILFPTGTLFRKFADFNNDGYIDIAYIRGLWGESFDSLYIVLNNQDMSFTSPDCYFINIVGLLEIEAADFDGNGYDDIAYTYYSSEDSVTILFNDGTGKFQENPLTFIESPESLAIKIQCYPNPFNFNTELRFGITQNNINTVYISILDMKGQLVRVILPQELNNGGDHYSFKWDGNDDATNPCSSGIYLLRCSCENRTGCRKLILMNN